MLRVLALEPYYGGSHRDFLDSWAAASEHRFELFTLPPNKWKWRMRHSALTFARMVEETELTADVLFCSDMVPLAELIGLLPEELRCIPSVLYFHENQLTYPVRAEQERDLHFALTNVSAAVAASEVWFNSAFHRDDFLTAITGLLRRMPDHRPHHVIEEIEGKARVMPVGIPAIPKRKPRREGPLRILWCARWEFDKGPETFFAAIRRALARHPTLELRIDVLGESFGRVPGIFDEAKEEFAACIGRWGYQDSRADYETALLDADVVVSTADHEFFGIAIVEAIAAGCLPLLPDRLVYPELLSEVPRSERGFFFYDGAAVTLSERLVGLAQKVTSDGRLWPIDPEIVRSSIGRFSRESLVPVMDEALCGLVGRCRNEKD